MRLLLPLIAAPLFLAACDTTPGETDRAFSATGEVIALSGGPGGANNACFTCHGMHGQGDGVSAPRLAGLDQGYLQKQMEDYASGLRPHDQMTSISKALDQRSRKAVAAYYAAMPIPAEVMADMAGAPPPIYLAGDASRGITACASCHGLNGEGGGAGNPQIAGQPATYTVEQIRLWRKGGRRNDARGVMQAAVQRLSDEETAAIAAWLSLKPASPARGSAAASASAGVEAAARPAASRETRRPYRSDGASGRRPHESGSSEAR